MACTAGIPHMDFGCGGKHLKGWSNVPHPVPSIDHVFSDTHLAKVINLRMAQGGKKDRSKGINNFKVRRMLQCGPNSWVAEDDPSLDVIFGVDFSAGDSWGDVVERGAFVMPPIGSAVLPHEKAGKIIFDQPARKEGKISKLKDWFEQGKIKMDTVYTPNDFKKAREWQINLELGIRFNGGRVPPHEPLELPPQT